MRGAAREIAATKQEAIQANELRKTAPRGPAPVLGRSGEIYREGKSPFDTAEQTFRRTRELAFLAQQMHASRAHSDAMAEADHIARMYDGLNTHEQSMQRHHISERLQVLKDIIRRTHGAAVPGDLPFPRNEFAERYAFQAGDLGRIVGRRAPSHAATR